ncbi:Adenine-specific methyltransferase [Lactococcus lactis subsp. lactis]|uniref:DNA adenine methylase n=1 Tax=Lactococcus lactis TaxID=1358 RepID=UPI00072B843E|nr:DNA adenine methylase [Lactococcus lactis]KST91349.1 Adenine-specific methyltransferase [Lactococcus lactis subsp. lactis]
MMSTKEIEETYDITRQTLNNWVLKEVISRPQKSGNKNVWTPKNVIEIEKVLTKKDEQLSLFDIESESLKINNRRYLGSKQKMLDFIARTVKENTENIQSVADIFGGTGVVADLFRQEKKEIIVNDILYSNFVSYQTWFGTEDVDYLKIEKYISELNELKGYSGYVTKNFGNRYFSEENAQKIDAIREQIEKYDDLNQREYCFLLTSLLYAMDKAANTVGHFDAYRKNMDSLKPLILRVPELNEIKKSQIFNMDANQLVRQIEADLIYIDTPYNSRGYESAYHLLENVAEWKKPKVEGVAKKAVNRSEKSSDYTKAKAPQAFDDLIQHITARYILVSFNNMAHKGNSRSNAKISNEEIIDSLKKRGDVAVFETDFNAFTTGKSKIDNHKELLYLCKVNS